MNRTPNNAGSGRGEFTCCRNYLQHPWSYSSIISSLVYTDDSGSWVLFSKQCKLLWARSGLNHHAVTAQYYQAALVESGRSAASTTCSIDEGILTCIALESSVTCSLKCSHHLVQ
jgi:hypothetical protein